MPALPYMRPRVGKMHESKHKYAPTSSAIDAGARAASMAFLVSTSTVLFTTSAVFTDYDLIKRDNIITI